MQKIAIFVKVEASPESTLIYHLFEFGSYDSSGDDHDNDHDRGAEEIHSHKDH